MQHSPGKTITIYSYVADQFHQPVFTLAYCEFHCPQALLENTIKCFNFNNIRSFDGYTLKSRNLAFFSRTYERELLKTV